MTSDKSFTMTRTSQTTLPNFKLYLTTSSTWLALSWCVLRAGRPRRKHKFHGPPNNGFRTQRRLLVLRVRDSVLEIRCRHRYWVRVSIGVCISSILELGCFLCGLRIWIIPHWNTHSMWFFLFQRNSTGDLRCPHESQCRVLQRSTLGICAIPPAGVEALLVSHIQHAACSRGDQVRAVEVFIVWCVIWWWGDSRGGGWWLLAISSG